MNKIDTTKPLEAVNKQTGKVVPLTFKGMWNGLIQTTTAPCDATSNELWRTDGTDRCFMNEWTLRNVDNALDTSKPLQTRSGLPVDFVGRLEDGRLAVKYRFFGNHEIRVVESDGRVGSVRGAESMDDVINKPTKPVVTFQNVYANGTVGSTKHQTLEAAQKRSQYGKVRVGILQVERIDGGITFARTIPTRGFLRTRSDPTGSYPFDVGRGF